MPVLFRFTPTENRFSHHRAGAPFYRCRVAADTIILYGLGRNLTFWQAIDALYLICSLSCYSVAVLGGVPSGDSWSSGRAGHCPEKAEEKKTCIDIPEAVPPKSTRAPCWVLPRMSPFRTIRSSSCRSSRAATWVTAKAIRTMIQIAFRIYSRYQAVNGRGIWRRTTQIGVRETIGSIRCVDPVHIIGPPELPYLSLST